MAGNIVEEYLVRLGADLDTGSFKAAELGLNQLIGLVKNFKVVAGMAGVVAGFVAVGKATVDLIRDTANAEMEYKKMANSMWITTDAAKSLSIAMKTMGASEQDIAWIPELRNQFFRLRQEMAEMATPADAEKQLAWIREIGYDIQSLQVKLKMLREWIVYYVIKYAGPIIQKVREFIQWLNDKLGHNMPEIAQKIARVLSQVLGILYSVAKVFGTVARAVYDFVDSLPANVKKWVAVFAVVGAAIMSGPFGMMLMALSAAMLLIQDFVYYMNGWNSSKTLAPVWEKLLNFVQGDGFTGFLKSIKSGLSDIADTLDGIIKAIAEGFNWPEIKSAGLDAINSLTDGVHELYKAFKGLFEEIREGTSSSEKARLRQFWHDVFKAMGEAVKDAIKFLAELAGSLGKIWKAVALALEGNFKGAAAALGQAIAGVGNAVVGAIAGDTNNFIQKAMENGYTAEGAAGLAANLDAESGLRANNAQDDMVAALGMTDEEYTAAVDDNSYSREKFVNDGVGYGIAQWTSPDRKGDLYDYAKSKGTSIGDMNMQLEFLFKELREKYQDVDRDLRTSTDSGDSAEKVVRDFERPADVEGEVTNRRLAAMKIRAENILDQEAHPEKYGKKDEDAPGLGDSMAEAAKETVSGGFTILKKKAEDFSKSAQEWAKGIYKETYAGTGAGISNNFVGGAGVPGNTISIGSLNVNVAGTNATPKQISDAIADKLVSVRLGRGDYV